MLNTRPSPWYLDKTRAACRRKEHDGHYCVVTMGVRGGDESKVQREGETPREGSRWSETRPRGLACRTPAIVVKEGMSRSASPCGSDGSGRLGYDARTPALTL